MNRILLIVSVLSLMLAACQSTGGGGTIATLRDQHVVLVREHSRTNHVVVLRQLDQHHAATSAREQRDIVGLANEGSPLLRDAGDALLGEDRRRLITRIEVVRIRPQARPDEPLAGLIEEKLALVADSQQAAVQSGAAQATGADGTGEPTVSCLDLCLSVRPQEFCNQLTAMADAPEAAAFRAEFNCR